MASNMLLFDVVRSLPIASISGTYAKLGSAFGHPMRILHFINDSNGTYMLSRNGIDDHVPLVGDSFSLYDGTSDEDQNEMARFEKGQQWWIKSLIAPTVIATTTNTVYLACMYGRGE